MTDIFACSMAKKGGVIKMENNTDTFACSMAKKSSVDVTSKSEEVA